MSDPRTQLHPWDATTLTRVIDELSELANSAESSVVERLLYARMRSDLRKIRLHASPTWHADQIPQNNPDEFE